MQRKVKILSRQPCAEQGNQPDSPYEGAREYGYDRTYQKRFADGPTMRLGFHFVPVFARLPRDIFRFSSALVRSCWLGVQRTPDYLEGLLI
jgi:hypothetical protein